MKTTEIAQDNDRFRKSLGMLGEGRIACSSSLDSLNEEQIDEVFELLINFDQFDENNDPYGERDFGVLKTTFGDRFFWKIDRDERGFKTMTIMRPEDY